MRAKKKQWHTYTDSQWLEILGEEAFHVLRQKGTEAPYSGIYTTCTDIGIYMCRACKNELFHSQDKFDSGTGWPSFSKPLSETSIITRDDTSNYMDRTEALCSECESHLGHLFTDGPPPTYLRYCMNSLALSFQKERHH